MKTMVTQYLGATQKLGITVLICVILGQWSYPQVCRWGYQIFYRANRTRQQERLTVIKLGSEGKRADRSGHGQSRMLIPCVNQFSATVAITNVNNLKGRRAQLCLESLVLLLWTSGGTMPHDGVDGEDGMFTSPQTEKREKGWPTISPQGHSHDYLNSSHWTSIYKSSTTSQKTIG